MRPEQLLLIGQGWLDILVLIGFGVATLYVVFTKPHRIIYLLPAAQTCFFFVEFGTRWTPEKIVPILFLVLMLFNKKHKIRILDHRDIWFQAFIVVLTISTIWGLLFSDTFSSNLQTSDFRSPFVRTLIQYTAYLNWILIYKITSHYCNSIPRVLNFFRAYITTTTILCLYGFYQILAIYLRLPLRGIVYSSTKVGMGTFGLNSTIMYRVNSLAIEPKQFSFILAIATALLITFLYISKRQKSVCVFPTRILVILTLIHTFCLLSTYSTSIYLALGLFITLYLINGAIQGELNKDVLYFILFLGGIIIVANFYYEGNFVLSILDARINDQFDTRRVESFATSLILDHPEYIIMGVGPGNYNFLLQDFFLGEVGVVENGYLDIISSHIITILFDLGIVGLLVLWSPVFKLLINKILLKLNFFSINQMFGNVFLMFACISFFLNPIGLYISFLGVYRGIQSQKNIL